ncbi:flavodoxin domain-containing protein [Thalassorhabdomicrobium marinisediminis]|uniref:flavodoxin domain-containing protein n=1 Tax=Thalassorhabdomicrobium marinisediminis TaxID=2170577 RepID=UPI0024938169|nr:flavodoxin domain-containing protein [Thalassorhabdomicrobium marinisediminis]
MSVMIAYATIEGQTGKIARFLEQRLRAAGCAVTVVDAGDRMVDVSFDGVEHVILAAPVHERRHPKAFEVFLTAHAKELAACKVLILSISLSAAFPEGHAEARDYLTEMKMRTGLSPEREACVAGAVRIGKYDYYAMQVLEHVVMRGRDYEASEGDHEFTDWPALAQTAGEFVGVSLEAETV